MGAYHLGHQAQVTQQDTDLKTKPRNANASRALLAPACRRQEFTGREQSCLGHKAHVQTQRRQPEGGRRRERTVTEARRPASSTRADIGLGVQMGGWEHREESQL